MELDCTDKREGKGWIGLVGLVMVAAVFGVVEAKETVLMESIGGVNERILFRLAEETNDFIEYERLIDKTAYTCRTFLKNQLTKSTRPPILTVLPANLDSKQCIALRASEPSTEQERELLRVDKILDLVSGECFHYQTDTFYNEYCHKEHVRQLDTAETKSDNDKPEFEDISMGRFDPARHEARKIRLGLEEPSEEERKTRQPLLSNFADEYNLLTVEDVDKYADLEIEQDESGAVLFSNIHLSSSDSYLTFPIIVQLRCQNEAKEEITNYALFVGPYSFIYTQKLGNCSELIDHQVPKITEDYFHTNPEGQIRVYGRFLYGNVEEECTKNWAWQRSPGNRQFDNYLQVGSTLYLEYFDESERAVRQAVVTVLKVQAEFVEVDQLLGRSFKFIPQYEDASILGATNITKITTCQIHFKKEVDWRAPIKASYLGNSIARISTEREGGIKAGDNFACFSLTESLDASIFVDLDVTVQKQLWLDYFAVLVKSNTKAVQPNEFKDEVFRDGDKIQCFHYLPHPTPQPEFNTSAKFTETIKLTNKNPKFLFPENIDSYYYIISIRDAGIIKLITKDESENLHTYLLTQGQIIKITELSNATKEIIKQNRYYQNQTLPSASLFSNYIYIKVSKLPNGSYFGGIWKWSDNVFFPRFQLFGESVLELRRTSGYAYIRVIRLQNLKARSSLAIEAGKERFLQHYDADVRAERGEGILLNKSYLINYTYSSGDFCGPPLNKQRKTVVTIRCGSAWFEIKKVLEVAPCQYWLGIESALLCQEGKMAVVENDDDLLSRGQEDRVINNGVMCFRSASFMDEERSYVYMESEE